MPTPAPGATLAGRYVVLAPLGAGGMGQVVKARDTKLDREVAVKVLAAGAFGDARARERLVREARAAARLAHAGIGHVYDVGETDDGGAFLVMELVDGETLRGRMDRGMVSAVEVLRVVVDCARALAFAHRAGSVHRDVKPDNVMIRKDGRTVLLDFGIAKSLTAGAPALTDAGMVVGTPAYLAPEQARGEEVDGRADEFALAVTAYEAFTGRLPWSGSSSAAVIAEILRDEPPPLHALSDRLPRELGVVVARAMSKQAEERYPDLDAFADALEGVASQLGASMKDVPSSLARTEAAPQTSRPVEPAGRKALWPWVALLGLGAAVAASVVASREASAPSAAGSPSVAPAPSAGPTAVTDLPPPPTSNPEALAAYRAGMQATRDADVDGMRRSFKKASELDPAMAMAHFRYADVVFAQNDVELARKELEQALLQRGTLSARDLAMAQSEEPLIVDPTPDMAEYVRRAAAIAQSYPLDAEAHLSVGFAALIQGDYDVAESESRRALELDPKFAAAWLTLGFVGDRRGDKAKGYEAYERCVATSSRATTCVLNMMLDEAEMGRCDEYFAHARQLVALSPDSPQGYRAVVAALARSHAPRETLKAAFTNLVRRRHSPLAALEADDELDIWTGDFAALLGRRAKRDETLAEADSLDDVSDATYLLVSALHEAGRDAEAVKTASAFLARRPLLTQASQMGNGGTEMSPLILAVARQSGAMPRAEWSGLRDEWYAAWAKPGNANDAAGAWAMIYAGGAVTREDAQEALASMPDAFPTTFFNLPKMAYGHMYALLERWNDAIADLSVAAGTCDVLALTPLQVRAHAELAQAYAATGDKTHACAELRWVIQTWGDAKPRSVTAVAARRSTGSLGCVAP